MFVDLQQLESPAHIERHFHLTVAVHFRSALIAILTLPIAVLISFIPMHCWRQL